MAKVKLPATAKKYPLSMGCTAYGIPWPEYEWKFHPSRRWRFDACWPKEKVALEIEGGAWIGGRHTSGAGFIADMEKYNAAVLLGWRLFRCTPKDVQTGKIFETLREALRG